MIKKSELILSVLCALFFGVILGFLIAPVKKGIGIGNNSGNTTNNNYGSEEEAEEEEQDFGNSTTNCAEYKKRAAHIQMDGSFPVHSNLIQQV